MKPAAAPSQRYTGEVVYLFAYDIAYEMGRDPIPQLLGAPITPYAVDASRRSPRHLLFYQPRSARLPAHERTVPTGTIRMEREIKLLPIGALSVRFRVPFAS